MASFPEYGAARRGTVIDNSRSFSMDTDISYWEFVGASALAGFSIALIGLVYDLTWNKGSVVVHTP